MLKGNSNDQFSYSPLGPLATAMSEAAQRTAAALSFSRRKGLQYGEVAITEFTLISLTAAIEELCVSPSVDGKPESISGADFEFWIEGSHGWLTYVVQAKKMKKEGVTATRQGITTYDVGYKVGEDKIPQIHLLLANEKTTLYALYNDPGNGPSRGFGKYLPNASYVSQICETTLVPGMDGITVVPGHAMLDAYEDTQYQAAKWKKRIAKQPDQRLHHLTVGATKAATVETTPRSFPWSCIAACPVGSSCLGEFDYYGDLPTSKFASGVDTENDPAYLLANSLYHLQIHAVSQAIPDANLFVAPQYVREIQRMVEAGVVVEPPEYVKRRRLEDNDLVRLEEAPDGSAASYVVTLFMSPVDTTSSVDQ